MSSRFLILDRGSEPGNLCWRVSDRPMVNKTASSASADSAEDSSRNKTSYWSRLFFSSLPIGSSWMIMFVDSRDHFDKILGHFPSLLFTLVVTLVICQVLRLLLLRVNWWLTRPDSRELRRSGEEWSGSDLTDLRQKQDMISVEGSETTCPPHPALYLPPPPIMMNRCTGLLGWVRNLTQAPTLKIFHINFLNTRIKL